MENYMADKKYTVKDGDTLKGLAKTFYGDPIFAEALRKINTLAPQDDVRVAMELLLPPRVVTIGPSEKDGDKTVKKVHYGKIQEKSNYLFPLPKEFQDKGYHSGERSFGSSRSKGARAHAGCDLYAPTRTHICAVADGVISDYHFYYWKTFCLEVNHGDFSVVYGEVQPPDDPKKYGITVPPEKMALVQQLTSRERSGLPNSLKKGSQIKQGDHIAYVGQLYENDGPNPFKNTMLHFEKYNNKASGAFTQFENTTDYINGIPIKPYKRRKDLEDPSEFLDNCELI
jgi:murein DD-endopeptidase MepM/ murein hydrolase activator NlpD